MASWTLRGYLMIVRRRLLPLLLILAFAATLPARAQELRGAVLLENSTTIVAGVIVEARAVGGDTVAARAVTNARGEFTLRLPAAGSYLLRGLRIGNHPTPFGELTVADDETRLVRFFLTPRPVTLSEVRVVGNRSCGRRALEISAVSTMLDETRKALQLSQLGGAATTSAEWVVENQIADLRGRPAGPGASQIFRGETRRPFVSLPADSLARMGYALSDSSGTTFYAPDAEALLADAFLLGHCFRTVPPRGVDAAWVGLAFEPASVRGDRRVGIEGTIWLDRASAELRRLDYSYANLPRNLATHEAGGQVSFKRVTDELWIVDRWTIRMPSLRGLDGSMRAMTIVRGRPIQFAAQSLQMVTGRVQRVQREDEVLFEVESAETVPVATAALVTSYCGERRQAGLGVLWGVLRDSTDAPVGNAFVEVEWDVGHRWLGEAQREWESRGRTTPTSPLGVWVACEIPTGVPLTAWGHSARGSGVSTLLVIPTNSLGVQAELTVGERPVRGGGRSLTGVVYDSLRFAGPVRDADVRVLGSTRRTFTDTLGRFEFRDLPPGPVTVVWRDVELDVLDLAPPAASSAVGERGAITLASPSIATFAARRCTGTYGAEQGVLVGEVTDLRGTRRPDIEVRARWGRLVLGRDENRAETREVVDTTDASGRFALCGVPRRASVEDADGRRALVGDEVELSASGPQLSAGPILVELQGAGALRRDIIVGDTRLVRVEGRVLDAEGNPLHNAIVTLAGNIEGAPVRSDSSGSWALENVPLQSTAIAVRAIGYLPARVTLDPKAGKLESRDVTMRPIPVTLAAAVILGQRVDARRLGFEERRSTGRGSFLDENVLKNMPISIQALRAHVRRAVVGGQFPFERLMLQTFSINGNSSCNPRWWVDGVHYGRITGDEQRALLARAKMLEVYEAWDAPAGYIDFDGCGAVLIWTEART